jgi:hypothetical protein
MQAGIPFFFEFSRSYAFKEVKNTPKPHYTSHRFFVGRMGKISYCGSASTLLAVNDSAAGDFPVLP